ncbi:unnamed protein product, partial [Ectocarpus sp. 8 AP-2014]
TLLEVCDLSLEVPRLFGGADPCIDVAFLFLVCFWCWSELSLDVSDMVDAFTLASSITESSDSDSLCVSPRDEGCSGDFIDSSDLGRGLVHLVSVASSMLAGA